MSATGYKTGAWSLVDSPEFHADGDGCGASRSYIIHPVVNDFYFLTDPDKFITKCFPNDSHWQLLDRPISKQQFEDLPFLQPSFYELKLHLVHQDKCVIRAEDGKAQVKIKMPSESSQRLQFTYNIFQLRNCDDEGEAEYPKLDRFSLHYRKGNIGVFELRFPPIITGVFKLEILCFDPENPQASDWICDFKIICEQGMDECLPLPISPRIGWGPGATMQKHGVSAVSHNDGVVSIDDFYVTEFKFKADKSRDIYAELAHYCKSRSELSEFVECIKNEEDETVVKVKAPSEGEFALQIYCRDQGNLIHENVCNYLLTRTIVVEVSFFNR